MIRESRWIDHTPNQVWKALTDLLIHASWWAAGDVKPIVGHGFTLDMGPWGQQKCEVLAVDTGRLLRYRFAAGTLDSTLTWRLEPENDGTRLYLEQVGFYLASPMEKRAYEGMRAGWPSILERIKPALDSLEVV